MYFWDRKTVNRAMGLADRQSYRVIPATASGRIRSDVVLSILNRSRVGIAAPFTYLPTILTPDEAAERFGVTRRELRRWTSRTRRVAPHFRINKYLVRFPEELLGKWLEDNSR